MDTFNPFANAWGDDDGGPSSTSSPPASSFKLPGEGDHDRLDRHANADSQHAHDPLGFKATTPSVTVLSDDGDDAWGAAAAAPVASTSAAAGLAIDEWSTAPSTPKPPIEDEDEEESSWKPAAALSPALDTSPPAWAIEGVFYRPVLTWRARPTQHV